MERVLQFMFALYARLDVAREDRGATATEYALLVAFIALAIVAGVTAFGDQLGAFFNTLGEQVGIVSAP